MSRDSCANNQSHFVVKSNSSALRWHVWLCCCYSSVRQNYTIGPAELHRKIINFQQSDHLSPHKNIVGGRHLGYQYTASEAKAPDFDKDFGFWIWEPFRSFDLSHVFTVQHSYLSGEPLFLTQPCCLRCSTTVHIARWHNIYLAQWKDELWKTFYEKKKFKFASVLTHPNLRQLFLGTWYTYFLSYTLTLQGYKCRRRTKPRACMKQSPQR